MNLTVIVPTCNEELHLRRCIDSVLPVATQVYVVDSGSDDGTAAIARSYDPRRVRLIHHAYEGPAHQKNWALDHLSIATEWVMFLDADEAVSPELADAIRAVLRTRNGVAGYFVNRRIVWYGRFIRHGGWYPNWNLRLFRAGRARYEMRRVHEHMIVDGPTAFLQGDLIHEDLRDLAFSIAKHNRYSTAEAHEYAHAEQDGYARLFTRDPLARRRWLKLRVWSRLPGKALWYFLWAYFVRLGFLDGMHGLRFHAMHAMFKQFDELKLWELRNYKSGAPQGGIRAGPDGSYGAVRPGSGDVAAGVAPTPVPAPAPSRARARTPS